MSALVTVTGNLGQDPDLRYTQAGKPICSLSIGATHRRHYKQADRWEDDGEPLWIRAPFWDQEAEHLAQVLHKGDRVTVSGVLVQDSFVGKDGQARVSLELRNTRFLGVVPKRAQNAPQAAYNTAPMSGTQNDPWTQPAASSQAAAGSFNDQAPF